MIVTLIVAAIVNTPSIAGGGFSFEASTTGGTESTGNLGLQLLTSLLSAIVGLFIANMAYQAALRTVDGEKLSIGDMFKLRNLGSHVVTYLVLVVIAIVCAVVIIIGWIVGLVLLVLLYFALMSAVDRGTSVGDSFKASIAIVRENLGVCLLLGLVFIVLSVLSLFTFGIAFLVVSPLMYISQAWVYRAAGSGAQQQNFVPQPDYPQNF